MNFLRKKKFRFNVDFLLADLCDVPPNNALLYVKVRLLNGGSFSDESTRLNVYNNHVCWGQLFQFECRIPSNPSTGILDPCICRASIRKELKGGKSFAKCGFVDVNLSEYAGSGVDGITRSYILEGYTSGENRQDNSILRINVSMTLQSSDTCFKVPPLLFSEQISHVTSNASGGRGGAVLDPASGATDPGVGGRPLSGTSGPGTPARPRHDDILNPAERRAPQGDHQLPGQNFQLGALNTASSDDRLSLHSSGTSSSGFDSMSSRKQRGLAALLGGVTGTGGGHIGTGPTHPGILDHEEWLRGGGGGPPSSSGQSHSRNPSSTSQQSTSGVVPLAGPLDPAAALPSAAFYGGGGGHHSRHNSVDAGFIDPPSRRLPASSCPACSTTSGAQHHHQHPQTPMIPPDYSSLPIRHPTRDPQQNPPTPAQSSARFSGGAAIGLPLNTPTTGGGGAGPSSLGMFDSLTIATSPASTSTAIQTGKRHSANSATGNSINNNPQSGAQPQTSASAHSVSSVCIRDIGSTTTRRMDVTRVDAGDVVDQLIRDYHLCNLSTNGESMCLVIHSQSHSHKHPHLHTL